LLLNGLKEIGAQKRLIEKQQDSLNDVHSEILRDF